VIEGKYWMDLESWLGIAPFHLPVASSPSGVRTAIQTDPNPSNQGEERWMEPP
jgi:hypothetical protein